MDNNSRTEIGELGEFGLISRMLAGNITSGQTVTPAGDDAAAFKLNDTKNEIVISTDMLNEGIHFDLSYMPLAHLGYKAVAVNVSDIAAMNGKPLNIVVGIGLSNRFSVEAVEELYKGIHAACQDFKIDLIGGDTTSSASGLILSVTATGEVSAKQKTLRSGAKVGDILCVTGDLGAAYMGLQVLEREKQVFAANPKMQPKLEGYEYLVQRQLKPSARMDIIHELNELTILPTAMIDVSDGLGSEILHLSKNSNVGFRIYEENVPVDALTYNTAVEFGIDPVTAMLNGGEDYELLFTINQKDKELVEKMPDVHMIGYVHELSKGNELITKHKNAVPLKAQGFQHF